MINSGIYKILNLITGMIYIGQAINFYKRWNKHEKELDKNVHKNPYLQRAWNKYGGENFEFIAIEGVINLSKLDEREQHWIDLTDCCNPAKGYNINPIASSLLGTKQTKEHIAKRLASRKEWKHTEETKKKLAILASSDNLSDETKAKRKAYVYTEEHKRKLSVARRKRIITDETRAKLAKAGLGRKHTEESKQKVRLAKIGHSVSMETRMKISASLRNIAVT